MSLEITRKKIAAADWEKALVDLSEKGYAWIPQILSTEQCQELILGYDDPSAYRKTVIMERHRYGKGSYRYFNYPLPPLLQMLREEIYPHLAPLANQWMQLVKSSRTFPATLKEMLEQCHQNQQLKPTALILKYGTGGHNTLHQDLYGDIYFPMQAVFFLNEPGTDFKGGEFVLMEQVPRAQSKSTVLNPGKGDLLIFTTNYRPALGSKGYYRAKIKHGVSEVHEGERHTLGIIFHDALQ